MTNNFKTFRGNLLSFLTMNFAKQCSQRLKTVLPIWWARLALTHCLKFSIVVLFFAKFLFEGLLYGPVVILLN
jgi:hypothetical protein